MAILEKIQFNSEQMGMRFLVNTSISLASWIVEGLLLTSGESFHGMNIILLSILAWAIFTFPILIIYCFLCATEIKKLFCDLSYLAWFVAVELFFYYTNDIDTFLFFTCIITLNSSVVYVSEIFFRNRTILMEYGHRDVYNKTNWEDVPMQIFKQPKAVFLPVVKSYLIAVIVMVTTSAIICFSLENIINFAIIFNVFLFSLCLLPAIILYQSARSLQLKDMLCSTIYFIIFIITELLFLPIVWSEIKFETDFGALLSHRSILGMAVIALGGIFVYMAEVYSRNRFLLKMIKK
jgi:hypothetical protein